MNDWFRSWHGAPTDPKWLLIGRKAKVAPAIVSAVVWALFDHASQQDDRGSVATFDIETYAVFGGLEEEQVAAVVAALNDKGVIKDGRLTAWEKRQPKREDSSTERVRAHRERKASVTEPTPRDETQCNAVKREGTLDTEEIRGDTDTDAEPDTDNVVTHRFTQEKGEARARASLFAFGLDDDEVTRSLELYPEFDDANLPILAEECISYHLGDKRKPPKNRYRAWLNWLRKRREFDERDKAEAVISKPVEVVPTYFKPFPDYYN